MKSIVSVYLLIFIFSINIITICQPNDNGLNEYFGSEAHIAILNEYKQEIIKQFRMLDNKKKYLVKDVIEYFPVYGLNYDSVIKNMALIRQTYLKEKDEWKLRDFRDQLQYYIATIEEYKLFKQIVNYKLSKFNNEELSKYNKAIYYELRNGTISKDTTDIEIYFAYMRFTHIANGTKDYLKYINKIKDDKFLIICVKSFIFRNNKNDLNLDSLIDYATLLTTLNEDDLKKTFYWSKSGYGDYYGWLREEYEKYERILPPKDPEKYKEHVKNLIRFRVIKKESDIDSLKLEYEKVLCNKIIVKTCEIYKKYGDLNFGYIIGVNGVLGMPCNKMKVE